MRMLSLPPLGISLSFGFSDSSAPLASGGQSGQNPNANPTHVATGGVVQDPPVSCFIVQSESLTPVSWLNF